MRQSGGLITQVAKFAELNTSHNTKKNERSRVADDSVKTFNELWNTTGTILDAARALYREVDEVKLREFRQFCSRISFADFQFTLSLIV